MDGQRTTNALHAATPARPRPRRYTEPVPARVALVLALVLAACTARDREACLARCRGALDDERTCETFCQHTCAELRAQYGIDEQRCRELRDGVAPSPAPHMPAPAPPPEAPPPADLTARCPAFVMFAFSCGIGRPPPDPTVDDATRRNNELVIAQDVIARCERRQPPYDEELIRCFETSAPDCARYRACADAVVQARPPAP